MWRPAMLLDNGLQTIRMRYPLQWRSAQVAKLLHPPLLRTPLSCGTPPLANPSVNRSPGLAPRSRVLTFSPDGKTLASGYGNGTIILWDMATRQPIGQPLTGHTSGVTSIVFSPDGKTFASSSNDGTIIIWDTATRRPIGQPLTKHTEQVNSVAFSPDGKTLASGSNDNTVILWDAVTHQPLGQLMMGNRNGIWRVAFGGLNGKMLAVYDGSSTITLWDVATRQPIGQPFMIYSPSSTFPEPYDTSAIYDMAFSPDGKTLVAYNHGPIILLNLDPQSWIEKICQRIDRNLTQAEWTQYFPDEPYRVTCPQWPAGQ